jgi:hypothetical protein
VRLRRGWLSHGSIEASVLALTLRMRPTTIRRQIFRKPLTDSFSFRRWQPRNPCHDPVSGEDEAISPAFEGEVHIIKREQQMASGAVTGEVLSKFNVC